MKESHAGTVKVTRTGADAILEVRDDASRQIFLRISIADFELSQAMQSGSSQSCEFELEHPERVGLRLQTTNHHVPRPKPREKGATITAKQWRNAMREFEEHGWEGTLSDCYKPMRRVQGNCQAVTFTRYVKPEDIQPCPKR